MCFFISLDFPPFLCPWPGCVAEKEAFRLYVRATQDGSNKTTGPSFAVEHFGES